MSRESKDCLTIRSFPSGRDLWRIDWFGKITYTDRLVRSGQPSVCVHLSLVESGSSYQPQTRCWVSIGTLVLLRIGDLWRNQCFVGPGDNEAVTFEDVVVESDTAYLKAGLSVEGHFLLPLALHPWHRGSTQSYCVRLRLSDERQLIVPCMELVRFYFGSSSTLLSKIFRPELRRADLYDLKKSVVDSDRPHSHITLGEGLPGRSAADVARIAGSPETWRCVARIGLSIAAPHNLNHVRTGFPFAGTTTLDVRGVWLPQGGLPNKTYVIHQLLRCSHPLPFQRLSYRTTETRESQRANTHHRWSQSSPGVDSQANSSQDELVEQDAGHFSGRRFCFRGGQRFVDLEYKSQFRIRSKVEAAVQSVGGSAPIHDLAVGEPGSSRRIRPAELILHDEHPIPEFLHRAIEIIRQQRHVEVEVLTDSGTDGWTMPLANFPEVVPECLFEYMDPTTDVIGPRRAAVFVLLHEIWTIGWVVIEHERSVPLIFDISATERTDDAHDCAMLIALAMPSFLKATGLGSCDQPYVASGL